MADDKITMSAVVAQDGALRLELSGGLTPTPESLGSMIAVLQLYRKLCAQGGNAHASERPAASARPASGTESPESKPEEVSNIPREQVLALAKALGI